jgi:hypothetical protein
MQPEGMSKRPRRPGMTSEEYLHCLVDEGKIFMRCTKEGIPDQRGRYWKIRDDIFVELQKDDAYALAAEGNTLDDLQA